MKTFSALKNLWDGGYRGFKGGVHLPEEKERTCALPIINAPLPSEVTIPLLNRVGGPLEALVKKGDHVLTGQKIGVGKSPFSAPVHASISGKVKKITALPHPSGVPVPSIVLESDNKYQWTEELQKNREYLNLTPEEIKDILKNSGIVGMGGAEFPAHIKASPPENKKIEYVLINGAECEPYLTADHRLMVEFPWEIVEGVKMIKKVVGAQKAFIGIEKNKPDAIREMKKVEKKNVIEIVELPVKYPQGGEKMLIKTILGREVPSGGLPMDVGVLVQNVGSARAVFDALRFGKPLIQRVVTITGACVNQPANLMVRLGTSLKSLVDFCGGFVSPPERIIMGGPMMGVTQFSLDVPIGKGTSGFVFLDASAQKNTFISPCVRCGRCINRCPLGLSPSLFGIYGEQGMVEKAQLMGVADCMECGVCTFICPAHRPVGHFIKTIKSELRKSKGSL